ncbi:methyltransferase [Streptomyces sp. NPDC059255]|uniref:methyltransferase n=1 Tax=Streptomyces sp. NPDC059255 TaxID=3346793 RepID=UPI0036C2384E
MTSQIPVEPVPAVLRVRELMTAGLLSHAISVLCDLGVPDVLETARSHVELAKEVNADPEGLLPFLRAACAAGVLAEPSRRSFELTELGQVLRADDPHSIKAMCSLTCRDEFSRTWSDSLHTARTGGPSFAVSHGSSFFEYMASHQEFATLFDKAMQSSAAVDNLLAGFDFSGVRHVVDVGGGRGTMLAAVLKRYPTLRGTLVDLPHVVGNARKTFAAAGVADRVTLVPGSFFDPIPGDADVYLLSRVIGNWNDEDSLRILRTVRTAMRADSQLVVVGQMPSENDRTHYPQQLDLYMFALLGARLRSYEEYQDLFAQVDLEVTGWSNFPDSESVLRARLS